MMSITIAMPLPPIRRLPFLFLLLLLPLLHCSLNRRHQLASACSFSEAEALRNATESLTNLTSWRGDSLDCCNWEGVKCSEAAAVIGVSLPGKAISGSLSHGFGSLPSLQTLNLSSNNIIGPLPSDLLLSSLSLLSLDLSANNLSGSLPHNLSAPLLQLLNLSSNALTGPLPSFTNLTSLTRLWLSANSLDGSISAALCDASPDLIEINLSYNSFSGNPLGFASCSRLQLLDLSYNSFTGTIPSDIYNLTSLTSLSLAYNSFVGPLSNAIGHLRNLSQLHLASNNLTSVLPSNLSSCTLLQVFTANSNRFSGSLDAIAFASLPRLENLDLNTNNLTGSIPSSLSLVTALKSLNLAKNNLSGAIPTGFNLLPNLTTFLLSSNYLTGSLRSLDGCQHLVSLILTKNRFNETIPQFMQGMTELQILALGNLQLQGTMPAWLQNCTKIQVLDLSWNRLTGPIPTWIGQFRHLFYLDLSNNSFTGAIPPELFSLAALIHPDNNMTGLQKVVSNLAIKQNVNGQQLQYSQVSAFPPSVFLSLNSLEGSIPPEIGAFAVLLNMDLSSNNLSGEIPDAIANMTDLELLDLSNNTLTGSIPSSLTRLTFLSRFNVSFNQLEGPIPQGNQFLTFTNKSYYGNPRLCGAPLTVRCGGSNGETSYALGNKKGSVAVRVAIVVTVCLAVVITVGAWLVWRLSRRNVVYQGSVSFNMGGDGGGCSPKQLTELLMDSQVELFYNNSNRGKLTALDLLKATNNFDDAHIVGCGGFGLVYRADLEDGSKLAIKKLTGGDCGDMEREFRAEVEALSKAQHKNLVPLEGYLQVGEEKLLLYAYMENGNLDYWLHERADGGFFLDWPTRLRIAQGAAHGLAYLHQVCNPHIVHRDIKSSNILLDGSFQAHLADFGLARLMMGTDTHVTTEVVGTLGYIPPEYGLAVNATPKGDIYSFGVVLLELLTRRRPVDVCNGGDLVKWVMQCRSEGKEEEIFDSVFRNKCGGLIFAEQMRQVLDVACPCLNPDPTKRPLISDVVRLLDRIGSTPSQGTEPPS